MCVLYVVDDDFTFQRIIKLMLTKSPVFKHVINFSEGKYFLNYINIHKSDSSNLPDIIFLDLNMPETDGWEILNYLNENYSSFNKRILVYIVTVSIRKIDRERALQYTFVKDFISKPLYRDKIIAIADSFYQNFYFKD